MDSISEKKREKSIDWPRSCTDRLPREVAFDILSRLPVTSLMRFRYVSKSWKKLSCDPHLINLHLSRSAKNSTCLIFQCDFPSRNQLQFVEFSDHSDKEHVRKIEPPYPTSVPEINVVGSCNGFICLSNSKKHDVIQIFNPFTRSYKQLPESRHFDDQRVLVGFGFHPLTNEYKVVRIVYYQNVQELFPHRVKYGVYYAYSQSEVQVFSMGSNEWRYIGKMPYQIDPRMSESLFVNGRLHMLTRSSNGGSYDRKIISFDVADEQFREVPAPDWAGIRMHPYPFAVLGECLSVVVYPRYRNTEIWVMKEYGVRVSWSKDYSVDVNDPIRGSPHGWTRSIQSLAVRVLCLTKNHGILLMHDGALASYDQESRELKNVMFDGIPKCLKNVMFDGIPKCFRIIAHMGSLVSVENE